jgi:hypothetical protein
MKYFITYADKNYEKSKERIASEAEATGFFDQVITYGKKDLSDDILNAALMRYERGGGYFVWKPYVVEKTLLGMNDGDILVYADCGCSVFKNDEWKRYFNLLSDYNAVMFMLPLTCEAYTRKNVLEHFAGIGKNWKRRYQVSATFFLLKKNKQTISLIREWKQTMVQFPELVVDVPKDQMHEESPRFIENRCDQSILSALAYKYERDFHIKILFHHFEGVDRFRKQAVVATRISDSAVRGGNKRSILKNTLYYLVALPYRHLYQKFWVLMK